MGELRADAEHLRIGLLDVLGVTGIGVFYLLMKRGLDVLLAHRHADPARVAMTGLSGGLADGSVVGHRRADHGHRTCRLSLAAVAAPQLCR